jgi:serine/threonine protein kinase
MNPESVRQIGPYPVVRFIAEGGISWVFEVTDPDRFDAPLALKMLKPSMSEEIFRRFKEEAGMLAGLDHPNLITIRTFGFDDVSGCHYYTMALVTGGHLGDHGAVPLEEAAEVFLEVLGGLAKLHERNVIHRDIKPSNILMREDGRPMLADLGLARGADVAEGDTWRANTGPGSLSAGMAIGTPAYMSPEQGTGRLGGIGKATDVFSFGLTMYSTLTGHSIYDKPSRSGPMSGTEILTLLSVRALTRTNLQFSFDSEFAIPASVQDVIRAACAINPADRYPDAPAMLRALRKALADSDAERASLLERLRAPDRAGRRARVLRHADERAADSAHRERGDARGRGGSRQRVERTLSLDRISRARTGYDKVTQPTQGHPGLRVDENVQFTVYRPARVPAERWVELLAFAHLAERRPDASPDTPDPVAEVRRQAQQFAEDYGALHQTTQDSGTSVVYESRMSFVPSVDGIEFNPASRSFIWTEDVHREHFRFRASRRLDGRVARGNLLVLLDGVVILADVPLAIHVEHVDSPLATPPTEATSARAYRRIFPSYSRGDASIVEYCEQWAAAMGDRYLRDVTSLRAGEEWTPRLRELIQQADVFQLFWSRKAMGSPHVTAEYDYALSLKRPGFVRPTYWEDPFPEDRSQSLPPEELRRLHFQRISVTVATPGSGAAAGSEQSPPHEHMRLPRIRARLEGLKDWFAARKSDGGHVTGGRGRRNAGRSREFERHQPIEALPVPGHPQAQRSDGYHAPAADWQAPPVERSRTPEVAPRGPRSPASSSDPMSSSASDLSRVLLSPLRTLAKRRPVGILIAIEGDSLVGERFKLFDGENKLGRGKDCEVKLPSDFISREHALLIHQEGVFAIRPLREENPVLVNGARTEGTALQDGDLVRLGRTTFRFRTAESRNGSSFPDAGEDTSATLDRGFEERAPSSTPPPVEPLLLEQPQAGTSQDGDAATPQRGQTSDVPGSTRVRRLTQIAVPLTLVGIAAGAFLGEFAATSPPSAPRPPPTSGELYVKYINETMSLYEQSFQARNLPGMNQVWNMNMVDKIAMQQIFQSCAAGKLEVSLKLGKPELVGTDGRRASLAFTQVVKCNGGVVSSEARIANLILRPPDEWRIKTMQTHDPDVQ